MQNPSEKKDKSNLKKLLAAKKKKNRTQNTTSAPKEDEEPVQQVGASQDDTNDAESPAPKLSQMSKAKEDDDESDDETNYTAKTTTKIVEHQADSSKKQDVIEMPDYMIPKDQKEESVDVKKPRKNANDITFGGGRPQFGNRKNVKGILGGDDFQSLDALDDDGKQNQTSKNKRTNADGGGVFEHLGSTPVQKTKKFEEEKEKEKPKGPPKFFSSSKGNKNVGGNNNTQITGTNTMYDFGVKYKSDIPEKRPQEKKEEFQTTEVRKDKRRINHDKTRFEDKPQQAQGGLDAQDIDDGFEIVRQPNQKRRNNQQQRQQFNRAMDLDGEQRSVEDGTKIRKGGAFGNLGGDSD